MITFHRAHKKKANEASSFLANFAHLAHDWLGTVYEETMHVEWIDSILIC